MASEDEDESEQVVVPQPEPEQLDRATAMRRASSKQSVHSRRLSAASGGSSPSVRRSGLSALVPAVLRRASSRSAVSVEKMESGTQTALPALDEQEEDEGSPEHVPEPVALAAAPVGGGGVMGYVSDVLSRVVGGAAAALPRGMSKEGLMRDRTSTAIVKINIGGQVFSTSLATMTSGRSQLLRELFLLQPAEGEPDPRPYDDDGILFIDHDAASFPTVLSWLRANTPTPLPDVGTREWDALRNDAHFYAIADLAQRMDELEAVGQQNAQTDDAPAQPGAQAKPGRTELDATEKLIQRQGRELERMRVELHRLQFEKERAEADGRSVFSKLQFAYNVLAVGNSGTGKSSMLNTILAQQVCQVAGAQAQGTRGCTLRDAVIDDKHFISYMDTQGLGADTSVTDTELLEMIMLSASSIQQMGIINNVLISFDLTARTTPAAIANQLTLCELFTQLRRSCFLCMTKWNTNNVISEWCAPLKKWVKKWRRAKSMDKITSDPPSFEELYRAYSHYLLRSLTNKHDGGAMAKIALFLSFFESRVIFFYNLDAVQVEDLEDGELEPYVQYLYEFYRRRALNVLKRGATVVKTDDLPFLRDDEDTIREVAERLIAHRDGRIADLEQLGMDAGRSKDMRSCFATMSTAAAEKIGQRVYDVDGAATREILALLGTPEGAEGTAADVCVIS